MIGLARLKQGLYQLDVNQEAKAILPTTSFTNKNVVCTKCIYYNHPQW